jgi:hypothetical protein
MRAKYCKCKNTYCISCCKDCNAADYWKQGIGNITGTHFVETWHGYRIQRCSDSHVSHVHIHDSQLTVGQTYYFTLENNHNGCYTVLDTHHSEGIHINTVSVAYSDCTECENANP